MDRNFLSLYNLELQHLREMAGEFAQEYPKIAGRLVLDPDGKEICPDPFVERLLEGFAYLAARVHVKLDAEFPRFTSGLLETVYPDYLCPMPSMAVVRFEPDYRNKSLAEGFVIPRQTPIRSVAGRSDSTPCTFRTAHDVTLWPLELAEASYFVRNLVSLDLPKTSKAGAAFRMTFEARADLKMAEIEMDALTFFLRGANRLPHMVLEHVITHGIEVWARDPKAKDRQWRRLPPGNIRPVGLATNEALLPPRPTTFEGYRLLSEYFAFAQRFLFFEVSGFRALMPSFEGTTLEVVIALREPDIRLEDQINAGVFDLFCTPVINLFEKRTDRINLSDRFSEFHVVVDRSRPLDYEVYSVESVTGYATNPADGQRFDPFYLTRDRGEASSAFFTINRSLRMPSEKERKFGRLSSYAGSEVFVSLVDAHAAPYDSKLKQLGLSVLCTNRHLPIRLSRGEGSAEFAVELNGPVRTARCLAGPTLPRASFAMGQTAWRLISHLSLNYFSIVDSSKGDGAVALRELLRLYVDPTNTFLRKQIDGVLSVRSSPVLRRVLTPGVITFARGLEVSVDFDEDAFIGSGIFVLGMVLEQFFARQVAINSFTETVVNSKQRGEVIRWPARTGRRTIL